MNFKLCCIRINIYKYDVTIATKGGSNPHSHPTPVAMPLASIVIDSQWRSQEFSMREGDWGVFFRDLRGEAFSAMRVLQFFDKNNAILCVFRPK